MKLDKDTSGFLSSVIGIDARLATSMASVRGRLSSYPNLSELRYGSTLRYLIDYSADQGKFYILSLDKLSLKLEVFSKTSPLYLMREALLRILSIASVLNCDYEFDIRSLFPYLVEVLANQDLGRAIGNLEHHVKENSSDIILARRIVQLSKEGADLRSDLALTNSKLSKISALLIISRYGSQVDSGQVSKETGLSALEVEHALKAAHELGYKAIPSSNGRFALVRI